MSAPNSSQDLLNVGKVTDNYFLLNLIQKSQNKGNGPAKTFKPPKSSVLARVKEFLPEMQQAQQDLQKHLDTQPASSVDIEEVTDGERHIEMNIALVEDNTEPTTSDSDSDSSDSDSDCEITGEDSAEGAREGCQPMPTLLGEVTESNLRLTPQRKKSSKKPVIEVIEDSNQ